RHEGTAAFFQILKNPDFMVESFFGLMATVSFMDSAIVSDAHERTGGIFHLMHWRRVQLPRQPQDCKHRHLEVEGWFWPGFLWRSGFTLRSAGRIGNRGVKPLLQFST